MADIFVIDDSPAATTAYAAFATALLVVAASGAATEAEIAAVRTECLRAAKACSNAITIARYKRDNP